MTIPQRVCPVCFRHFCEDGQPKCAECAVVVAPHAAPAKPRAKRGAYQRR
jgi:hypothetical protein